ncbi:MAG TPA: NADH-quinone oxidoreductase subunit I [Candidatus Methanoperedens sp.]|nr:NADH-quinone oxidoreductase subunit I [Candidatus Methanoperedens sp.]
MIGALVTGFLTTLKHLFRKPITIQYPEERREPAPRFRGLHALRCYPESGAERCISCCLCARICPTQCIRLVTSGGEKKVIDEYDVDLGHCLFCGLCAEVCPEEALVLSPQYEASYLRRGETILRKSDLLRHGVGR